MNFLSGEAWVTIGAFIGTQAITLIWTLATTRADARSIRSEMTLRLDAMQQELGALKNVLVTLADFKGEMRVMAERSMLQGRRVDELTRRVNETIDRRSHVKYHQVQDAD